MAEQSVEPGDTNISPWLEFADLDRQTGTADNFCEYVGTHNVNAIQNPINVTTPIGPS